MATPKLIKEFRDYLAKQDPNYVNKNGVRVGDAIKELNLIYKQAVIKERKENFERIERDNIFHASYLSDIYL